MVATGTHISKFFLKRYLFIINVEKHSFSSACKKKGLKIVIVISVLAILSLILLRYLSLGPLESISFILTKYLHIYQDLIAESHYSCGQVENSGFFNMRCIPDVLQPYVYATCVCKHLSRMR